jgi:hypothetical protein
MDSTVTSALVAGFVSLAVGVISYFSNRSAVRHEVHQTQFKDILAKRLEVYPKLWRIHIEYETNWDLEGKPKTKEWAQKYATALNEFNLDGGLFFSESLYSKFHELRSKLYEAVEDTEPNQVVDKALQDQIRAAVYGRGGPGMSTFLKDDLGSYRSVTLQRRPDA